MTMTMTDATTVIIHNHAEVERAFAEFDRAEGSRSASYRAMLRISDALAAHTALEQELLWPAVQDLTGRHDDEIDRQLELSHLLDVVLIELGTTTPADRRFAAKLEIALDLFRVHARATELQLLPELRRRLDDDAGARLGAELARRERRLAGGPSALAAR
jgi:hypothetical protein